MARTRRPARQAIVARRIGALLGSTALVAELLVAHAIPASAAHAKAHWQVAPPTRVAKRLAHIMPKVSSPSQARPSVQPVHGLPRAGGSGRLTTAATTVGGLGLQVGGRAVGAMKPTWDVTVASSAMSAKLVGSGAVLQIKPSHLPVTSLTVNYSTLAQEYGADWANRLQVLELTGCSSLAVSAAHCSSQHFVASHNDIAHQQIIVPAMPKPSNGSPVNRQQAALATVTLALATTTGGSTGDFGATSLSRSASWQGGDSSGNFSWSYPLKVPPTQGGPTPQLGLSYSSGAVDGQTASTNNQPSWVGDGFDLTNNYVERRYQSCADDGNAASGDECWFSDNASLVLNGKSSELVYNSTTKLWHMKDDDGSRIEKLTGAVNGDSGTAGVDGVGEYWKVTSTDGTQYIFGVNQLPGWSTGHTVTNSVWTVPVFGNNTGEPCHAATFDAGYCQQAWRWNLDRVIDPNGNSMAYFYTMQQNAYGRDATKTKKSIYEMGGYLNQIIYGLRSGAEYAGAAPQKVTFTAADRCVTAGATCTSASANWSNWPDVPWDQYCSVSATVTSCNNLSPAFFITKQLTAITTQVLVAGAYQSVDSWSLAHTFPNPNYGTAPRSNAALWLSSITRTGLDGGSVALSGVTFDGTPLPNRVNRVSDGLPPMNKFRIYKITSESGDTMSVTYSGSGQGNDPSAAQDCAPSAVDTIVASSNGTRCYPAWYAPYSTTKADWFRKYVVLSVVDDPHSFDSHDLVTSYQYQGTPGWAYDDDPMTPTKKRLWNQWRGYQTVRTITGDAAVEPDDSRAVTDSTFYRGLGANINDSQGAAHADPQELAGRSLETVSYAGLSSTGVLGRVITSTITTYSDVATATSGALIARFVLPETTTARTWLSSGGWRTARTTTSYNGYGLPTQVADEGDVSDPNDDQCSITLYAAPNTSAWIVDAISRSQTYAAGCGQPATFPDDAISDTLYYYDNLGYGAAPTKGNATTTKSLHDYFGTTPNYITTAATVYDANGRATQVTDVLSRITKTAYTPAAGGPVTRTVTTSPLDQTKTKTTDLDPGRGLALDTIDENGKRTDFSFDALGRLISLWQTNHPKASNPSRPNYFFAYQESTSANNWTKMSVLNYDGSTYTTTYNFLDGMLRARQTQAEAPGPYTLVKDTFYNSRGLVAKTYDGYAIDGEPSTTLYTTADNQVDAQTWTQFDGANRPTAVINAPLGLERYRTTTAYNGNSTDTLPPAGGSATRVVSDSRGRKIQSLSFPSNAISGAPDLTTAYTYTPSGKLHTVASGGSTWSYEYDVRGFRTDSYDPDKGHDQVGYDNAGRAVLNTDALGNTTATSYDALDRQTEVRQGTAAGPLLASWTYDTLAFGQLTSSSTYANGAEYKTTVSGYNDLYQPTGQTVTIPAVEGPLAGSYVTSNFWLSNGLLGVVDLPAVGSWATERVVLDYNNLNQPIAVTSSAVGGIVSSAYYDPYSQLAQLHVDRGSQQAMDQTYAYDSSTHRLARELVTQPYTSAVMADESFGYSATGDLVKQSDAESGDTQCFGYNTHKQLTDAWTPASGDCSAAADSTTLGGPAPYWQSWSYSANGERQSQTTHGVGAVGQVVEAYNYPSAGAAQPHGLTSIDSTGAPTKDYHWNPAGQLLDRPGHAFTWDSLGHLASDTATNGDVTSYLYDASGNRLIRHDAKGATLYLGDTELRWEAGAPTVTRYYSFGGDTVAVRTGSTDLHWLLSDPHNTALASVDVHDNASIDRRYENPYGADRGSSSAFPGDRGFVNGVNDPEGSVHLGAREYLPSLGQFNAVDPLIDYNDPAQLNPYVYSHDDPVNGSDPTGTMVAYDGGDQRVQSGSVSESSTTTTTSNSVTVTTTVSVTTSSGEDYTTTMAQTYQAPPKPKKKPLWQRAVHFVGDITGINDVIGCIRNPSVGGCVMAAIDVVTTVVPVAKGAVIGFKAARAGMELARGAEELSAVARTEHAAVEACRVNSFDPRTRVLLAGGGSKPIGSMKLGDRVLASDPVAGGPAAGEPVTDVIVGTGNKHLVDVTVRDGQGRSSSVTATDEHPFWVPEDRAWVAAVDLHAGQHLVAPSAAGVAVTAVVSGVHRRVAFGQVYNLTVADLHTYYVQTSTGAALLVHNCGGEVLGHSAECKCGGSAGQDLDALSRSGQVAEAKGITRVGNAYQKHSDPSRGSNAYPAVAGKDLNKVGQDTLDEILTSPQTALQTWAHPAFGDVMDFRGPQFGARFSANGDLIGFL